MKFKELLSYIIIILVVITIRTFVVTPIKVNGDSMNPTLKDGYLMILKKYEKNKIDRFDIVVANINGEKLIKRVVGLPKEEIKYENNELYINGELLNSEFGYGETSNFKDYCTDDEYFLLGDNRVNSADSRIFGCIKKDNILGTTNYIIYPFKMFGKVK